MEYREWATRILSADTLDEKLLCPGFFTDDHPGLPAFWNEPTRPHHMRFRLHSRKERLPPLHELCHPDKRAICLHRFAGHELLAVEIMAYALLAFPNAPKTFRKGIAHTLREEQEHVRLYTAELKRFGVSLGDLPLYKHFWAYTPHLRTPEQYLSVMSLTFEMANLDYAPLYGTAFAKAGDSESAQLMERILKDEIGHVSFGWNWLKKLTPKDENLWNAWTHALPPNLTPVRSIGNVFQEMHRKKAGISEEWIIRFKEITNTSFKQPHNEGSLTIAPAS